jgi:serine/threonine protein kinase
VLGKGSYGMVVLAEEKITGKRYAMKMIPKFKIKEVNLLQSPKLFEIRKHPFLVDIKETFLFNDNVYIVMEYLAKGDLYFYIHQHGIELTEVTIRNILAEIIVALHYLHEHGILYRALKPENILISDDGHIKLTDYAFSKLLNSSETKGVSTFVGAVEYMAPEIIKGQFGEKADIWELGIVAFELKFRENPIEEDGKIHYSLREYEELLKRNFIQTKINHKIGHMSQ